MGDCNAGHLDQSEVERTRLLVASPGGGLGKQSPRGQWRLGHEAFGANHVGDVDM